LVGGERIRLPTGPVEREHQLAEQPLAERMRGDRPLELGDELAVASEVELGVDARLDGEQPPLLQPPRLGRDKRLVLEIRERASAPKAERVAENGARPRRIARGGGRAPLLEQLLEAVEVELVRPDPQPVAGRATLDPIRAEQRPEPRDVAVEGA